MDCIREGQSWFMKKSVFPNAFPSPILMKLERQEILVLGAQTLRGKLDPLASNSISDTY